MKYEIMPCTKEDEELIEEKLDAIDYSIAPAEDGAEDEELVFKITDDNGNIIAGCIVAVSDWKMANLDILWVSEKHRKMGLGSALILKAEKAARERGCCVMMLSTFSFQARPLYEKHGFTLCGTVRDYPRGHENYTLTKRLDEPFKEYVPSKDLSAGFEICPGNEADAEFICDRLHEYNSSKAPRLHEYIPLNYKLLDEKGNMIAAIFSGVYSWNSFAIDMIWVDEPLRNQGIGSELLSETEKEAKEKGAYFALAEGVFDWQADFFKKSGYMETGALKDCPKGHFMYILEKRF